MGPDAPPRRLLVIKWGALGDMVAATPALAALRHSFPQAHITLLTNTLMQQIAPPGTLADEILIHHERLHGLAALRELARVVRLLRARRFDTAVNLRWTSDRCAVLTRLSGAERRISSGPAGLLGLYTVRVPHPAGRYHEIHRNLDIARAAGAAVIDETPVVHISPEHERFADTTLAAAALRPGGFCVLHPGASRPHRAWPPERFAAIAARLHGGMGIRTVVTWGPGERQTAAAVAAAAPDGAMLSPETPTVGHLAALIRRGGIFLSNCTGPMNVAVAVRTPVVAILGSSDPTDWGPYGPLHRHIKSPLVLPGYTDEEEAQAMAAVSVGAVWELLSGRIRELGLR
jgi:ADP-heptose:LPS heptosyltransferase